MKTGSCQQYHVGAVSTAMPHIGQRVRLGPSLVSRIPRTIPLQYSIGEAHSQETLHSSCAVIAVIALFDPIMIMMIDNKVALVR